MFGNRKFTSIYSDDVAMPSSGSNDLPVTAWRAASVLDDLGPGL
jgi:hypothetical protein